MGLSDQLSEPSIRTQLAQDCASLMDEQVAAKKGVGGLAIKAAYAALKGIGAGYIPRTIENLLPKFIRAMDPMRDEGIAQGDPASYLCENQAQAAEVLLGVTDEKIRNAQNKLVIGTYNRLRQSVKGDVEAAIPGLSQVLMKYTDDVVVSALKA